MPQARQLLALLLAGGPLAEDEFELLCDEASAMKGVPLFDLLHDEGLLKEDRRVFDLLVWTMQRGNAGSFLKHPRLVQLAKTDTEGVALQRVIRSITGEILDSAIKKLLALPFPQSARDRALAGALTKSHGESGLMEYAKPWARLLTAGADPLALIGKAGAAKIGCSAQTPISHALAFAPTHHFPDGAKHLAGLAGADSFERVLAWGGYDNSFASQWLAHGGDRPALLSSLGKLDPRWEEGDRFHLLHWAMREAMQENEEDNLLARWEQGLAKGTPVRRISDKAAASLLHQAFLAQVELFQRAAAQKRTTSDAMDALLGLLDDPPLSLRPFRTLWRERFMRLAPLFETPGLWQEGCKQAVAALAPLAKNPPTAAQGEAASVAFALSLTTPALSSNLRRRPGRF